MRGVERQAERDIKRALKRRGTAEKISAAAGKVAPYAPALGVTGAVIAGGVAGYKAKSNAIENAAQEAVRKVEAKLGKLPPDQREKLLDQHRAYIRDQYNKATRRGRG